MLSVVRMHQMLTRLLGSRQADDRRPVDDRVRAASGPAGRTLARRRRGRAEAERDEALAQLASDTNS